MSTPILVALNVLDLLTGGSGIMGKHSAPEKDTKKSDNKSTVTRLYGGAMIVSKK